MSKELDSFRAEIRKKLNGLTIDQWNAVHPGKHLWAMYHDVMSCGMCGTCLNKDGGNAECYGTVKITTR